MYDPKLEKNVIKITGNGHKIPLDYDIPEWESDKPTEEQNQEPYFMYKGEKYYLSEFERIDKNSKDFKDFDGVFPQSAFDGILIKIVDEAEIDGPKVKAYHFY